MKLFITSWIIATVIFFFFQPLNYFGTCYGKICMDYSAPAIFSITPNFIQPACNGFCNAGLENKSVFDISFLIVDIFSGLIISGLIVMLVKISKHKKKNH